MIKKTAAAAAFLAAFIITATGVSAKSDKEASLSHISGTYDSPQKVTVEYDSGSKVYYTTDGSKPDTDSKVYSGSPIIVKENTVVRMAAYSDNELVSSDKAEIRIRTAAPTASADSGEYKDSFSVQLSCSDKKAVIYYTLDGSTPTKESKKYKKAIKIKENTTLKFAAFSPDKSGSKVVTRKYTISSDEFDNKLCQDLYELVNKTRAEYGLSPLKTIDGLTEAAEIRAKEYSRNYSHLRPNGSRWETILTEYGLKRNTRAENLAYYYKTAKSVLNCWMNDSWHRGNILSPDAEYIGIGCYSDGYTTYWCQLFIGGED